MYLKASEPAAVSLREAANAVSAPPADAPKSDFIQKIQAEEPVVVPAVQETAFERFEDKVMGPGERIQSPGTWSWWTMGVIILLLLVIVWWWCGMPKFGMSMPGSELMINEAAWEEVPRGLNMPYDGASYSPIPDVLWNIEETGSVRQVILDPLSQAL
jgi:hypothetical protein